MMFLHMWVQGDQPAGQGEAPVAARERRQPATEIVRQVRVKRITVQITHRGKVIAELMPVREPPPTPEETSAVWTDLDYPAVGIGARWPTHVSAVDAAREERREW